MAEAAVHESGVDAIVDRLRRELEEVIATLFHPRTDAVEPARCDSPEPEPTA